MIQRVKHILQRSLTFVASIYEKNIYIITRKVYASIKVKNTSYDSKLRVILLNNTQSITIEIT